LAVLCNAIRGGAEVRALQQIADFTLLALRAQPA
jgi:hypothetical protein